jgi:putative toxin-antitoxin system antitoxin component (TIGR02293 family)
MPITKDRRSPSFLLGLGNRTPAKLISSIEAGFPYSAFTGFVSRSSLDSESVRTAARLQTAPGSGKKAPKRLSSEESDRLYRLSFVFSLALQLFEGDADAASRWLRRPAPAFAGSTPLERCQTEVGVREVERLIGRLEHGVYS